MRPFSAERIRRNKDYFSKTPYAHALQDVYCTITDDTGEAVYFCRTGYRSHDSRFSKDHFKKGVLEIKKRNQCKTERSGISKEGFYLAMLASLWTHCFCSQTDTEKLRWKKEISFHRNQQSIKKD